MLKDAPISRHLPLNERDALVRAALLGNAAEIDRITDALVQQGLCRPRSDMSRMPEWIRQRPIDPKTVAIHVDPIVTDAGKNDIGAEIAAQFRGNFAREAAR